MGIATTTATAAIRELSDGNSQGTRLGQSAADLIGFYGVSSAIAQSTMIGSLATTGSISTAPVNATSGGSGTTWAFSSSTQALMIINAIQQLRRLGLIA